MRNANNISVIRTTKGKLPRLPFAHVKQAILGEDYQLDVSFVGRHDSAELHKKYKKKNGPATVLSFPLDDNVGTIVMSLEAIRRHAPEFGHSYHDHILFLFIHGCVHLLGYTHGTAMDAVEKKYHAQFLPHLAEE